MNKVILMGRLTRDPEVRYSTSGDGQYQDKDGKTVYTTEVVVENQEFAESKAASDNAGFQAQQPAAASAPTAPAGDGFMNIPDNVDDSGLPFNF